MSFKLSKKSIEILQNLSQVHNKMMLVEGNEQASSNKLAHVYATAKLPDALDCSFGMFDMNVLLGKFRLFGDSLELEYNDSNKTITLFDEYSRVTIPTDSTELIASPIIGRDIGVDPYDIVFTMNRQNMNKMVEFMKVMGTDTIAFAKPDDDDFIRVEGYIYDKMKENKLKGYDSEPNWFIRLEESTVESFKYYARLPVRFYDDDYTVTIRQYLGTRGKSDGRNANRVPAIQFEGEYIRYFMGYLVESENQKGLRDVK